MNFAYWLPFGGAIFAAYFALRHIPSAAGAPQQAAIAGIALCIAVIPYVFARSVEGAAAARHSKQMVKLLEEIKTGLEEKQSENKSDRSGLGSIKIAGGRD